VGEIDPGILPLLAILAMSAFLPVSEIAQIGRQLADTLGSTRRYYGLENEPVTITDGTNSEVGKNDFDIIIQDVNFSYPGQNRHALEEITVSIPSGGTLALVGTSGAGKTTLAQILMRFWDPDTGNVKLKGVDLKDYNLDTLRAHISLVAQDTYLFNDTLRANILIARPEATEAELQKAIKNAALDGMIATLPDGLETAVGERGTSLSGGQRQRVAIARAFLKDAPVLILDEATSHLDAVNETAIRNELETLKANRTTIIIAHRLSTVRDADKIVVMEEGRIVETGRHEELLKKGGLYARLISRQLASTHNF
jgi:ATP-binding cassette subfamily C protein CydCD